MHSFSLFFEIGGTQNLINGIPFLECIQEYYKNQMFILSLIWLNLRGIQFLLINKRKTGFISLLTRDTYAKVWSDRNVYLIYAYFLDSASSAGSE